MDTIIQPEQVFPHVLFLAQDLHLHLRFYFQGSESRCRQIRILLPCVFQICNRVGESICISPQILHRLARRIDLSCVLPDVAGQFIVAEAFGVAVSISQLVQARVYGDHNMLSLAIHKHAEVVQAFA